MELGTNLHGEVAVEEIEVRERNEREGGQLQLRTLGSEGIREVARSSTHKVMNSQMGLNPARAAPTASPPNPDSVRTRERRGTNARLESQLLTFLVLLLSPSLELKLEIDKQTERWRGTDQ